MVNPDNPSSGHASSGQSSVTSANGLSNIELGLLDLVPVSEGMTMSDALHATICSARAAERAGYDRFWLAEHHNSKSLASSATTIMIGQVASATHSISVGLYFGRPLFRSARAGSCCLITHRFTLRKSLAP